MKRPESLARLFDAARDALSPRVQERTPPAAAASRVFEALATSVGDIAHGTLSPPPAYRHLPSALRRARTAPGLSLLVEAFEALEPELRWRRRPGSEAHGTEFHDGHANADIVGPTGLERRSDVWFGATLVAPDVRYIDHRHPPEEVYIVLSEGEWYREGLGWHAPGIGGVVYNPPNVVHAMRSGSAALLALWLLPSDPPS
ncbi:MAG: dimethylsulfonioproprionate lyase family protein [Chromatiales bacterium]|nr:dimethylsulfonioproprionate lyase family protein [Chromatiales bacterium]